MAGQVYIVILDEPLLQSSILQLTVPGDLMGDQLTGPQFLYWSKVAQPRDGAAEKEFFGLPFNASG